MACFADLTTNAPAHESRWRWWDCDAVVHAYIHEIRNMARYWMELCWTMCYGTMIKLKICQPYSCVVFVWHSCDNTCWTTKRGLMLCWPVRDVRTWRDNLTSTCVRDCRCLCVCVAKFGKCCVCVRVCAGIRNAHTAPGEICVHMCSILCSTTLTIFTLPVAS